jgi:amino acid permease
LIRILVNIAVIILALPFILKRDISTIKKLAYIGVASVLFNVSVVVGTSFFGNFKPKVGFTKLDSKGKEVQYHGIFAREKGDIKWIDFNSAESFSILLQGVAAIFFCYVSHQMVFPLTNDLQRPTSKRLNKIFFRTHLTELIVYSCVGFLAYLLLV